MGIMRLTETPYSCYNVHKLEIGDTLAYIEFEDTEEGKRERKAFWLSPDGISLIAGFRREGESLEQIALRRIGVSDRTLDRWRRESEDLERALRQTDNLVNSMVEESLLRRALGYMTIESDEELVEGEMRVVRRRERHIPPDTKACLSWLYSRRSDRWRAQQEPIDASAEEIAAVRDVLVTIATTVSNTESTESLLESGEDQS